MPRSENVPPVTGGTFRSVFGGTFRSLRVRNYRLFATGQLISLIFGWVQITAQDWLVLGLSHDSGTALGLVTACQFTPILLLSLYAGKLADRFDKRITLVIANTAWLILASAMATLVLRDLVQLWQVFLFAAAWGCVTAVETPVRQSFASELVGSDLLGNALSLSSATFNTARVIGPALGGLTIATLGTGAAFAVNAASYVGPLVALSSMNPAQLYRVGLKRRTADQARIRDGLRYVRSRPDLLLPILLIMVLGMLGFNFQLTLPLMAKKVYHVNAAAFGLLGTSLAAGALAGALAGASRRARPSAWLVVGAALTFGVLEMLVGFGPTYLSAALLLVPTGFFMIFYAQASNQRVQLGAEPEMRGRVMSLYILAFLGTNPLAAPVIGWCGQTLGPRSTLWLGGAASLTSATLTLVLLMRRSGGRPRARLKPWPMLHVVLPAVQPAASWQDSRHGRPAPDRVPGG